MTLQRRVRAMGRGIFYADLVSDRSAPPPADRREVAPDPAIHGRDTRFRWPDLVALAVGGLIILISWKVGFAMMDRGYRMVLPTPPLVAFLDPQITRRSIAAITVGVVGIALAIYWRHRERAGNPPGWRRQLIGGWILALSWSTSLALIYGFEKGYANVLTGPNEYLNDLPLIDSTSSMLSEFSRHILQTDAPYPASMIAESPVWTTHVAGHPPLATLVFYWLQEIGLPGGFWASTLCIVVGTLSAIGLPVAVRALGAPDAARRLIPFVALFPGTVWMGVSADGLFTGVVCVGLGLVCVGAVSSSRWGWVASFAGGVLLGSALYLNYGLVLCGIAVLAAFAITMLRSERRRRVLARWGVATAGVGAVALSFTLAGFNWIEGLQVLRVRYYQGIANRRPYFYFVWANFGAFSISTSPFVFLIIHRAASSLRGLRASGWAFTQSQIAAAISVGGFAAIMAADLSGMSKAETERIWLPFAMLCWAGCATLRGWLRIVVLAGSVISALLVNHWFYTGW